MNRLARPRAVVAFVLACAVSGGAQTPVPAPLTGAARAALRPGQNTIAVHARQTRGGQFIDVGLVDVIDPPPARVR